MAHLYIALVHYPVLNRMGDRIASAVTNLDLHDLARSCCTYGIPACYIVTPLKDQQALAHRLTSHWIDGKGGEILPERREALKLLQVTDDLAAARFDVAERTGKAPVIWATSAREGVGSISHAEAREILRRDERPCLLVFGTGWGLAPDFFSEVDGVLDPIPGVNGYNHLSVRSAASILMDRLLGGR
ncbi:MAG: RNA methyltransferase [Desulfobacteraceae bacterium]|nr:RNA methyltransferase [Desulfobacteraceae bacterium]